MLNTQSEDTYQQNKKLLDKLYILPRLKYRKIDESRGRVSIFDKETPNISCQI